MYKAVKTCYIAECKRLRRITELMLLNRMYSAAKAQKRTDFGVNLSAPKVSDIPDAQAAEHRVQADSPRYGTRCSRAIAHVTAAQL